MEPFQRTYEFFGLTCASEIDLPGCRAGAGTPDVIIRHGSVPAHLEQPTLVGGAFEAAPSHYLLRIHGVAAFWVRDGREIIVDRVNGADDAAVSLFLLGSALTALMHQRDVLALHASAVVGDHGAIAIAGAPGRGKSTLTAALAARGYRVLCDDLTVITLDHAGRPLAHPGVPQLKLWPDALQRLGHDPERLATVRRGVEKRRFEITDAITTPVPLARIVVLASESSDSVVVEAIEHARKFEMLRLQTKLPRAFASLANPAVHFRIAAAVAAQVPMVTVTRPRRGDTVAEVVDHIVGARS